MMPETVILLIREGVVKFVMLAVCFTDNRYPGLGSGIYFGVRNPKTALKNVWALFKRR